MIFEKIIKIRYKNGFPSLAVVRSKHLNCYKENKAVDEKLYKNFLFNFSPHLKYKTLYVHKISFFIIIKKKKKKKKKNIKYYMCEFIVKSKNNLKHQFRVTL